MTGFFQDRHPILAFAMIAGAVAALLSGTLTLFSVEVRPPFTFQPAFRTGGGTIDLSVGPDRCPVHGVFLDRRIVPIRYGLPHGSGPSDSELARFPFGREWVAGGCCLGVPHRALILQCPECVIERRAWNRSHQSSCRRRNPPAPARPETAPARVGPVEISPLSRGGPQPLPRFLLDPLATDGFMRGTEK